MASLIGAGFRGRRWVIVSEDRLAVAHARVLVSRSLPRLPRQLFDNRLDDESMEVILKAIMERGGIYSLNIGGNPLKQKGADALLELVATSTALRELHLPNMKIEDDFAE